MVATVISISIGRSIYKADVDTEAFDSFLDLDEWLRAFRIAPTRAYITAPMVDGQRNDESALPTVLLLLDFDDLTKSNYQSLKPVLREYLAIAYTTRSHTVENPRLRVLMKFSRPVTREEYPILYENVAAYLSELVTGDPQKIIPDPSGKSISHAMFVPHPGSAISLFEGVAIDVERFLKDQSGASRDATSESTKAVSRYVTEVLSGTNLHDSTLALTAQLVSRTKDPKYTINLVRSLMDASDAPRDNRFRTRYRDISRLAEDAVRRFDIQIPDESIVEKIQDAELPLEWLTKKPPTIPHLVPGWIPEGVVALLVAEGGVGKTTLVLKLCIALALGSRFLGYEVQRCRVLYVGIEDPPEMLRFRLWELFRAELRRIARDLGVEVNEARLIQRMVDNLAVVSLVGEQFHVIETTRGQVSQHAILDDVIPLMSDYDFIAIDPMARLHGGNENDNAVGTALVNAIERVVNETGTTALIPHHTGKSVSTEDSGYGARGASAISDAARVVMRLALATDRDCEDFDNVSASDIAAGSILRLSHPKNSYGPRHSEVWLRRVGIDLRPFTPRISEKMGFEESLEVLVSWIFESYGERPVFKTNVRDRFKEIFDDRLTRNEAESLFDAASTMGTLIKSGTKTDNPQAKAFVLAPHILDTRRGPAASTAGGLKEGKGQRPGTPAAGPIPKGAAGVEGNKRKAKKKSRKRRTSSQHRPNG